MKKCEISKEYLEEKYINQGLSAIQIAEELKCSDGKIYFWLKKYDIPSRSFSEANTKYHLTKEYLQQKYVDERLSTRQIAEEVGCGKTTIRCWLNRFDIPFRTISESQRGELSYQWKGFNSECITPFVKDHIYDRDTYECQFCSKTYINIDGKNDLMHVHHIDQNRRNNNPENLILLCSDCHAMLHNKPNYPFWERRLGMLAKQLEVIAC